MQVAVNRETGAALRLGRLMVFRDKKYAAGKMDSAPNQKRSPLKAKGPMMSVLTRCATKAQPQTKAAINSSMRSRIETLRKQN